MRFKAKEKTIKIETNIVLLYVNIIELKTFIGILNYSAIFKANYESIYSLFATDGTDRDIFKYTITKNRFTFLLDCLLGLFGIGFFEKKEDRVFKSCCTNF